MAIADDFSITVTGDITHVANTDTYHVLELHRWLQDLADDESPAIADDVVDITSLTPSERSTDNIINLLNGFNIDDTAAEYLYGGSITQDDGATVYSGLKVLGAVNDINTQLQVIQDHGYYNTTSPFWGDQSGGGLNGDAATGVLMRILVKSRQRVPTGLGGADIDGKRVRVQARAWGDSYDFFNVTLGQGESVAAIGTTPDAQNDTAIGVVAAWATTDLPTNDVEGWQEIDINNGDGDKEYYSQWHYNGNALGMKATYEHVKWITGNDDPHATEPYDMIGEFFLGITHFLQYGADTGVLTQNEVVYWGTTVSYATLTGTFSAGDYVVFRTAGGAVRNAGKVLFDDASDMIVALEDLSDNIVSTDTIDNLDEDADAIVSGTTNPTLGGGEGWMLAENVATDDVYIQLISGVAPVDAQVLTGFTSTNTVTLNVSPTPKTVPKLLVGSYTGSLIGAFGIGIEPDDLASTDSVQPLVGAAIDPPNNVIFEVSGMTAGDRILVGKKDTGNDFDWEEMTTAITLDGAETAVNVGATIPTDCPQTGILRITLDNGQRMIVPFTAQDGTIFTVSETFPTSTFPKGVMIAWIDKAAADADEEFTLQYNAPRTLWIRVREGTSGTPMKTYEALGSLTDTGGSAVVSPIDDY
jgi:hypothetical protein